MRPAGAKYINLALNLCVKLSFHSCRCQFADGFLLSRFTHSTHLFHRWGCRGGIIPRIADDGDRRCTLNNQNKGTPARDGDIPRIACASDQSEFAVIGEDNHSDVTADPFERK